MPRAHQVCLRPGCPHLLAAGESCPEHPPRRAPDFRPSSGARGYGRRWAEKIRAPFLAANPVCVDCGGPAEVPDHDPVSRRELVAMGDPDPDAWHHLVPRCVRDHNRRTGRVRA